MIAEPPSLVDALPGEVIGSSVHRIMFEGDALAAPLIGFKRSDTCLAPRIAPPGFPVPPQSPRSSWALGSAFTSYVA